MVNDDRPIETNLVEDTYRPGRRKLRVRLFIFLLCLAISCSMWIFIELMKDYTSDITYNISFAKVPEDLILVNQADSTITVGVNAQGFELLVAQFMRKRTEIVLDLSDLRIVQGEDGYSAFMPASRLLQQVGRQLRYSKSITYIRPDTLLFRFSEIYRKRVPIKLDISYSFANEYQLYDTITYSPQTVMVSSIKDVIDTLRFVRTKHIELNNLDSNLVRRIPLRNALRNNMIRYSEDSVKVSIKVQKYTEAVFNLPVHVKGNSIPVRIFPDQVELTCLVPMSDFREVEARNFEAEVVASPSSLAANKQLPVLLIKIPANVRMVRLKPDYVEYIIISK